MICCIYINTSAGCTDGPWWKAIH